LSQNVIFVEKMAFRFPRICYAQNICCAIVTKPSVEIVSINKTGSECRFSCVKSVKNVGYEIREVHIVRELTNNLFPCYYFAMQGEQLCSAGFGFYCRKTIPRTMDCTAHRHIIPTHFHHEKFRRFHYV